MTLDSSSSSESGSDYDEGPPRARRAGGAAAANAPAARAPKATASSRRGALDGIADDPVFADAGDAAGPLSPSAAASAPIKSSLKGGAAGASARGVLYDACLSGKPLHVVVAGIVARFKSPSSRKAALVDLINFIFHAAGCPKPIIERPQHVESADAVGTMAAAASQALEAAFRVGAALDVVSPLVGSAAAGLAAEASGPLPAPPAVGIVSSFLGTAAATATPASSGGVALTPSPYPGTEQAKIEARKKASSAYAAFRGNFVSFWTLLMAQAPLDVLFSGPELVEVLLDWLVPLAEVADRRLRHVATMAAMHLGAGLLRRAQRVLAEDVEPVKRQLDSASAALAEMSAQLAAAEAAGSGSGGGGGGKKAGGRKGAAAAAEDAGAAAADALRPLVRAEEDKVAKLNAALSAASASMDQLTLAADAVYKAVFSHRYRDVAPEIRADAIDALGTWMLASPEAYLSNNYLKYLGWMLYDRESWAVRARALDALTRLYDTLPAEYTPRLADVMGRFRGRVAEMLNDVDAAVALRAVGLLHRALREGHLDDGGAQTSAVMTYGVTHPSLEVRRASGALLLDFIPIFAEDAPAPGIEGEGGGDGGVSPGASKSKRGGASGANKASALRAAAAAAEAAQRARTQLMALVGVSVVAVGDLVSADPAAEEDPSAADLDLQITLAVQHTMSSFWGLPGAGVLSDWAAFSSLLLAGGGKEGAGEGADLTPVETHVAVRMLQECVSRACGYSVLDGRVPVYAPGAGASGGGGGRKVQGRAPGASPVAGGRAARVGGSGAGNAAAFHMSYADDDVDRSRDAASAALGAVLPDLLVRLGGDPAAAVVLAAVLQCLSIPAAFGGPRAAKAFTDVLYHLSRLVSTVHTRPEPLSALSAALRHVLAADFPRHREATTALQKLAGGLATRVQELTEEWVPRALAAAAGTTPSAVAAGLGTPDPAAGAAKAGRGRRASRGGAKSSEAEAAAAALADTQEALVLALRRLHHLATHNDLVTAVEEAAAPPSGTLFPALNTVLATSRRLLVLAATSGAAPPAPVSLNNCGALHYGLPQEALALLCALASGAFEAAATAAAGTSGSAASVRPLEDAVANAQWLRDAVMHHGLQALALRHPAALAEEARAAAAAAVALRVAGPASLAMADDDSEDAAAAAAPEAALLQQAATGSAPCDVPFGAPGGSGRISPAGYTLPYSPEDPESSVTLPQYLFLARLRRAGYEAVTHIGMLCGSSAVEGNAALASLAWAPPAEDVTQTIAVFVGAALAATPRELAAMGIRVAGLDAGKLLSNLAAGADLEEDEGAWVGLPGLLDAGRPGPATLAAIASGAGAAKRRRAARRRSQGATSPGSMRDLEDAEAEGGAVGEDEEVDEEESQRVALREAEVETLAAQTQRCLEDARAAFVLLPLANLSLSASSLSRLGHMLGRRVQDADNEAGVEGLRLVRSHLRRVRERDPQSLLEYHLRSMREGCAALARTRAQVAAGLAELRTLAEAAKAEGRELTDDSSIAAVVESLGTVTQNAESLVWGMLELMRNQVSAVVARGAAGAKVRKALQEPLKRMLVAGIDTALSDLPHKLSLLSPLVVYLPYLDAADRAARDDGTDAPVKAHLKKQLRAAAEAAGIRTSDLKATLNAAGAWWDARLSDGVDQFHDQKRGGMPIAVEEAQDPSSEASAEEEEALRGYAPLMAFTTALDDPGSRAQYSAYTALRVHSGLTHASRVLHELGLVAAPEALPPAEEEAAEGAGAEEEGADAPPSPASTVSDVPPTQSQLSTGGAGGDARAARAAARASATAPAAKPAAAAKGKGAKSGKGKAKAGGGGRLAGTKRRRPRDEDTTSEEEEEEDTSSEEVSTDDE